MAHADFRGTPTYFAVFIMRISSKNVNQNMLKIPYFLKKICKNSPGSARLGVQPQTPRAILPTPTVLLQTVLSLSPFLMKVLRRIY